MAAAERRVVRALALAAAVGLAACAGAPSDDAIPVTRGGPPPSADLHFGRAPAAESLARLDVDVNPAGAGLPVGRGSVAEGKAVYARACASCHGPEGQGMPPAYPQLVGRPPAGEGFQFATDAKIPRTIGNYWPYATTLYDYIRRAMPLTAPGSLSANETYAVTAWLLSANQVIGAEAVLDSAALVAVKMPARDRFVRDDRRGGPEIR
jgi:cytochrome c